MMGLLVECPKCKGRNGLKKDTCKCGFNIKKTAHKTYWIEYYDETATRKRERIGPSKDAAEQRLRVVLKARTEERHIDKDLAAKQTLGSLSKWYMELPEVKAKESYNRDAGSIQQLKRHIGENTRIKDITVGRIESYQRERLAESSRPVRKEVEQNDDVQAGPQKKKQKSTYKRKRSPKNTTPATVNREVACLKTILNRAVHHKKLSSNPLQGLKMLLENNVRKRLLTGEELEALLDACAPHVRSIVLTAYITGMRKSEIIFLTWNEVDQKKGFIRLSPERTKTKTGRNIPIHPALKELFKALPRALNSNRVFLADGIPVDSIKTAFNAACRRAGIEDFCFHDLRHCALNNLRLAGNDYFRIMAISGHKTMSVFKRYNLVTEDELAQIKWKEPEGKKETVDTYMDTTVDKIS
jgi:integrase